MTRKSNGPKLNKEIYLQSLISSINSLRCELCELESKYNPNKYWWIDSKGYLCTMKYDAHKGEIQSKYDEISRLMHELFELTDQLKNEKENNK